MPNRTLLITRPDHDTTTFYCFHWSQEIVVAARRKNVRVIDLYGRRANKREVEGIIKTQNPNLAFFNGHGTETAVYGYRDEPLIAAGKNDDLLKSKIVYSIACNSARKLGPSSVRSGSRAFIGYENEFIFIMDTSRTHNPTSDNCAKPFFKSSNQVLLSLIKNNTAEEAVSKSKDAFGKWITYYRTHDLIESPQILPFLIWDRESLVAHGDMQSRFV